MRALRSVTLAGAPALRSCLLVAGALALGIACAGKVDTEVADAAAEAAVDAAADVAPEPEPTPTTTATSPPTCPTYRPRPGIPCMLGLSCSYPCGAGETWAIKATCPANKWVIENTAPCGG